MTAENPMREEISEKLSEALSQIDRPGSFCVSGEVPSVLPGLEVAGLGPIGLPLTVQQAEELKTHCDQAPHGKGTQTVVDTSVRRVWRMGPDRFSLTNPDWDRFVAETVAKVQEGLGLEKQELESHLYDLLLYEPGSFFLPHRDGEKHDRMVATLVIVLPSSYEGGEIVVRHDGQEQRIDFSSDPHRMFKIHFAAFYADCEHEVRPLKKGYRLCLVYNLTLAKSEKSISAPRASQHVETIASLLREWAADDSSEKLAITLDHKYTEAGLAWDALKGVDRVKARVLDEAAGQASCKAYLALLTLWESGSAEDAGDEYGYGYGRRSRWHDDDDDDEGDDGDGEGKYTMEEVYDTSLTAKNWSDSEGNGLPIGTLDVEEEEILDPEALKEVKPQEEYEGYTGNEGMTLERWYRRAAIFLWPERRHLEILCGRDSRNVVPVLNQMVAKWRQTKGKEAAGLKTQCVELAKAILAKWPETLFAREGPTEPKTGELLESLALLDDPLLIHDFLGIVMVKDVSVDPGQSLAPICQAQGWGTFQRELLTLMESTNLETMERNVRLLESICLAKPGKKKEGWDELYTVLAQALVLAVEAIDEKPLSTDWRTRKVERADVLAGLARALIATEQFELLSRFVDHALVLPTTYPLKLAHMPALVSLEPWFKKNVKKPCAPLTRWVASCREQLESLTAKAPAEPTDFHRSAPITCKCADCAELVRFLHDPKESTHRFTMKKERRDHLEREIRNHHCDLDCQLDRRGSPQTLVCTKNKASYQVKLKTYHQDQEYLATVRSIEASLPAK
jgi:2OG-Fe(II) oxygenase superfamily